jgi:hypothetical protein
MKAPKALALAVGGGILFLPPIAQDRAPSAPRASAELSLPSKFLPFSLGQVLNHFNEAFGKRPFIIDERTVVYTDRENPDEIVIITVADLATALRVVLLATGDYGVNYMREFFEALFFLRQETERFYSFLDRGPGIRSIALERFKVQMSISHAGSWIVIALEFAPAEIYLHSPAVVRRPPTSFNDAVAIIGKGKPITARSERL